VTDKNGGRGRVSERYRMPTYPNETFERMIEAVIPELQELTPKVPIQRTWDVYNNDTYVIRANGFWSAVFKPRSGSYQIDIEDYYEHHIRNDLVRIFAEMFEEGTGADVRET